MVFGSTLLGQKAYFQGLLLLVSGRFFSPQTSPGFVGKFSSNQMGPKSPRCIASAEVGRMVAIQGKETSSIPEQLHTSFPWAHGRSLPTWALLGNPFKRKRGIYIIHTILYHETMVYFAYMNCLIFYGKCR